MISPDLEKAVIRAYDGVDTSGAVIPTHEADKLLLKALLDLNSQELIDQLAHIYREEVDANAVGISPTLLRELVNAEIETYEETPAWEFMGSVEGWIQDLMKEREVGIGDNEPQDPSHSV